MDKNERAALSGGPFLWKKSTMRKYVQMIGEDSNCLVRCAAKARTRWFYR